jgi:ABC-type polysaccharide/polyol phosphate transport system ATPase subunit
MDISDKRPAVDARDLTKQYRVYRKPFDRLKEAITRRPCHDLVEALSGVSFQAHHGDTLGIIGENGAGKSTLLKILAMTLRPTSGKIEIEGRLAALLELGSGFHPEFSGRENIYLNAALLGLNEKEVREREGDIIEFSGLGEVIDRAVKTYSTGMYMRLGFSIATSVDPEILVVDEALSVGDQRFQQKCVERMVEFSRSGKTIILCSHSLYLINELCAKTIWLRDGRVRCHGKTSEVIAEYLAYLEGGSNRQDDVTAPPPSRAAAGPEVLIEEVSVTDAQGSPLDRVQQFQTVIFRVRTRRNGPPVKGHASIGFEQSDGRQMFGTTTKISGVGPIEFAGEQIIELVLPSIPIVGGEYWAKAMVGDEHALRLIYELKSRPFVVTSDHPEIGMVWIHHHWRFQEPGQTVT